MDAEQLHRINLQIIERYRAGEDLGVPGMHRERLALLTTTGRRTGERHTTPMLFVEHGDDVLVVASNDGAVRAPAWYANLRADPRVHVELPDDDWDADARVLTGDERAAVWARLVADYPFFTEHEERAGRELPLVVLSRTPSPADGA